MLHHVTWAAWQALWLVDCALLGGVWSILSSARCRASVCCRGAGEGWQEKSFYRSPFLHFKVFFIITLLYESQFSELCLLGLWYHESAGHVGKISATVRSVHVHSDKTLTYEIVIVCIFFFFGEIRFYNTTYNTSAKSPLGGMPT